uniref:Phosphatase PAP2 family protein n=1 Tax=Schlesneria paludicola TaxID=360056 RepID=A0A7C2P0E4_9PLAN
MPTRALLQPTTSPGGRSTVPVALLFLGLIALTVDVPVARFCDARQYPRIITDVVNNAEPFGHAAGVVLIAATVAVLDSQRRRWAPGLCLGAAIGGGLSANVVKLLVGRIRPRNFDFGLTGVADTFTALFPFGAGGSSQQSFPSAHTATATGLAVALAALYPQGRWWFATLAALVAVHRVESSAHYPSDVCAGALLGWIVGNACLALTMRVSSAPVEAADSPAVLRRAA